MDNKKTFVMYKILVIFYVFCGLVSSLLAVDFYRFVGIAIMMWGLAMMYLVILLDFRRGINK